MQHFQIALLVAAGSSLLVTGVSGFLILPLLRKLKYGQSINEIGPSWHSAKQGTPTMGGITFIIGSLFGLLCGYLVLSSQLQSIQSKGFPVLVLGVLTTMAFSLVGFIDDYLKVVRKENLGLLAWQKIAMQSVIAVVFLVILSAMGRLEPEVYIPFAGYVYLGIAYYPLAFLLLVGVVNAVNLTDGLDGLASSVTMWVMCGFLVLMALFDQFELSIWTAALGGGCIGFLFWNFYPAKIFMGDTGSMFLGGAVGVLGFCMGRPELIIIIGLVYMLEALSVMIQVSYFKLTHGKRLFKMTPIHHHFEMIGWKETKIVAVFSFVSLVCAVLAVLLGFMSM